MVCKSCGLDRSEKSFFIDGSHLPGVCKPCIFRPGRSPVQKERREVFYKKRVIRTQEACQNVVDTFQQGGQSFVYVLKTRGRLKIGFSKHISKRIQQLKTGFSGPVELIAVAPGGRQLEQELHARFKSERVFGEWFKIRLELFIPEFSQLPGALIFLLGYAKQDAPLDAIE